MSYQPKPIDNSKVELSPELNDLIETLACNNHELWAQGRIAEGWKLGPRRDQEKLETPLLVPYGELPESEKAYDRQNAVETLKSIVHFGGKVQVPLKTDERASISPASLSGWVPGRLPPLTPEEYRKLGHEANNKGQSLLACDISNEGLDFWPADSGLLQIKALALARMGSTGPARELLINLAATTDDEEIAGILARIFKDIWLKTGDPDDLKTAAESYFAAYRGRPERYWTGINAATLFWALGETAKAEALALEIARICTGQPANANYWLQATLAEAALVIAASRHPDGSGDEWQEAEDRYRDARKLAGNNFGQLFSTWRNARIVLRNLSPAIARRIEGAFNVPRVAVFAGHRIDTPGRAAPRFPAGNAPRVKEAIREQLIRLNIGVGFSTAASGSDILFLEALRELGGETHIVLPCNREQFVEVSVADSEGDWKERFDTVVSEAEEVIFASDEKLITGGAIFRYSSDVLDGLALMRAAQFETGLVHMAVWDGRPGDGPGGTCDSVMRWQARHHEVDIVTPQGEPLNAFHAVNSPAPVEEAAAGIMPEIRAMIFADVKHFSQLTEQQIPCFLQNFIAPIAELVKRTEPAPIFQNTWGDGFFFVFANACDAGQFALRLRDCVAAIERLKFGLPTDLTLRIALHAGPVFRFHDHLIGRFNYFGSHVNRTARIEPVTPEGRIYATDLFAALSTMDAPAQFRFDYVGRKALAKNFGRFALYDVNQI